ncbi:MAG: transcriptional regulator [Planctomycetes bacterium]|jgi:predicted transcriptional regulator|nr:transcriptional regulator [Planctomycetota bacterium]
MSNRSNGRKPTDSEVKILSVIWKHGPKTVREVYDLMSQKETIGYTTVLKFMQIMTEKGLLNRDASIRPQVFSAAQPQHQTQRVMLRDLVDRAFAGSAGNLALQALSTKRSTPKELREIRALLDKLEGESA